MKKLVYSIIVLLSMIICTAPYVQAQQENGTFFYKLTIGADWSRMSVTTAPEYLRNIPKNSDDGDGPSGLIQQSSYKLPPVSPNLDFLIGSRNKTGLSCGFGISISYFRGSYAERNYTNAVGTSERGEGAALTFFNLNNAGLLTSWNNGFDSSYNLTSEYNLSFTPEFMMELPLGHSENSARLSMTTSFQKLVATTGWDRYNSWEYYQKSTLAYIIPIKIMLSTKYFEFGPLFYPLIKTQDGRDSGIKITPVGFSLALSLNPAISQIDLDE